MRRAAAALLAFACLLAPAAVGGMMAACEEPQVFPDAAVNAVILPYRYTGARPDARLSEAARALSRMLQQEVLFSMLKYDSVGATELVRMSSRPCNPNEVLQRVRMRPGHGIALLWGRIYEEGNDLFVQSYIRFLRKDASETVDVTIPGGEALPLQLRAAMPTEGVALAPRRLATSDVAAIEARLSKVLVLRGEPRDDAPGRPLTFSTEPLAYTVLQAQGDWMMIRSITGDKGWVRARTDDDAWALRRFLPELGYFDGVVGFLRLRAAGTQRPLGSPQRVRAYGWMERAFEGYERAVGPDTALSAIAMARAMKATVLWNDAALGAPAERRSRAAALFADAANAKPDSSDLQMLAAVTQAAVREAQPREAVMELDRGLLAAAALNPRNQQAFANLQRVYQTDAAREIYPADELRRRVDLVRAAQGAPAQSPP
jgi:hypothetical protein